MAEKLVHPFSIGDRTQSDLLGGKGANLAEMVRIGLNLTSWQLPFI